MRDLVGGLLCQRQHRLAVRRKADIQVPFAQKLILERKILFRRIQPEMRVQKPVQLATIIRLVVV